LLVAEQVVSRRRALEVASLDDHFLQTRRSFKLHHPFSCPHSDIVIMSRAESAGDQVAIRGKIAARYDPDVEREVIGWFKQLLDLDIPAGMNNVQRALHNGIDLVKLALEIQKRLQNPPPQAKKMRMKPNTLSAPFKQMENIQVYLNFCEKLGMNKTSLFQTVDLYEGRNMAQVMTAIQQLGTECQRFGFDGPVIGSKPTEKNVREFSDEQLKAGQAIIGLQAGTNKCASQSGMSMGGVRHIADIKADDLAREGTAIIGLQSGSNKGASQSGMSMGAVRHVSDIRADDMSKEGSGVIGLQAGSNKGASQAGMSMGAVRHVSDIRADDMSKEGSSVIGLQAGSNKGASQKGMSMGSVRHVSDIRADDMSKEGSSVIGLQAGSNKGASQSGMSMGSVRHVADIRADKSSAEGQAVIGLQAGSNKGASQSGMAMGATRHVADIKAGPMDKASHGVTSLQYGSTDGASQSGMSFGGQRDIRGK
jgi:hypothetical protein